MTPNNSKCLFLYDIIKSLGKTDLDSALSKRPKGRSLRFIAKKRFSFQQNPEEIEILFFISGVRQDGGYDKKLFLWGKAIIEDKENDVEVLYLINKGRGKIYSPQLETV